MAITSKTVLFIIVLTCVSCGNKVVTNNAKVFLSKQISSGLPHAYIKKNELISNLKRHQLILDTDHDGILDKDDSDIDDDGIPNDCDYAPFDKQIGNADSDKDAIPDFCDINPHSDKVTDNVKSVIQKNLYSDKKIFIIEDDLMFSEDDISFLTELIERISEKAILPSKQLSTIAITRNLGLGEYGAYDNKWTNIRFTKDNTNSENIPTVKLWHWVLTHEFFHFVASANPDYYESFRARYADELKKQTLVYPTEYSKDSEGEYFAELETSKYFNI